jgi:hypothetical protein
VAEGGGDSFEPTRMLSREVGEKVNKCYLYIGVCKMRVLRGNFYYFIEREYKLGHMSAGRFHSSESRRGGFPRESWGSK